MIETYEAVLKQDNEGNPTKTITIAKAAIASVLFKMQNSVEQRIEWRKNYGESKGSDPSYLEYDQKLLVDIKMATLQTIASLNHSEIWDLAHRATKGTGSQAIGWRNRWMIEVINDTEKLGYK